jgi:hypothetical protein
VNAAARVSLEVMRGSTAAIGLLCAFGTFACASSSADYTPQITVVPGAAARSLWILSKRAEAGEDVEADEGTDAEMDDDSDSGVLVEPVHDGGADLPEGE